MDLEAFQNWPTEKVAQLVHEAGPKVCVFPIKGTRRWVMLEHPTMPKQDFAAAYVDKIAKRGIELFQLFFDHGLDTLLTPSFDMPAMERGESYMQIAADIASQIATHPDYLSFYEAYKIRIRFYGDYRRVFAPTPYAYLSDLFDEVTAKTMKHDHHRLFYGFFAHDPTEIAAELAVRYYIEHGCAPDRRALIELYYGEYIEPVDLFIGFGKLRAFDMPLLATGREDLYFTVSPSAYLTGKQLRDILYDHLYARCRTKADLQPDDWVSMGDFYRANMGRTLGVGKGNGKVWHPLPQVELPPSFNHRPPAEQE